MEEFLYTDIESLCAKLKYQEKQLKLKRRWLMGLPLSDYEQKQLNRLKFQENKTLPESFLREDDVYYETIKAFVEKGFRACNLYHVDQDNIQMFDLPNDLGNLLSMLDDMTNNGLQLIAEILTGGSIKFGKIRWKMKKIIKECLPEVLGNLKGSYKINIAEQLCQLLRNSHNFRRNRSPLLTPASQSYHAAATKVLDGLEDMPFQTLSAMHRKLRGIQGYVPQLRTSKSGWGRSILIAQVRKSCMMMLSELGEENKLQEPLAKAMAVGGLWTKLIQGCPFVTEFQQFSPEDEALQNEIAKAIWLLKEKVRFPELKNLQLLLDPKAELSNRSLQTAVKNLLTEYLFECSDMDTIPDYLLETLCIINRTSRTAPYRFFSKEEKEEEVEHVLNVSSQIKHILWDLLPEYEFDEDFADAYMEYLEESDDGDDYDDNDSDEKQEELFHQNNLFHPSELYGQTETIGETNPTNFGWAASTIKRNGSSLVLTPNRSLDNMEENQFHVSVGNSELRDYHVERQEPTVDPENPPDFVSLNFLCDRNFMHDELNMSRNQYLILQEACDKTSIVAYCLIGCVLDKLAQIEGLGLDTGDISYLRGDYSIRKDSGVANEEVNGSVIVQVLEELLPSFPESLHTLSRYIAKVVQNLD
ncbi:uncharacterized protein LOC114292646 isoform X6 [Camellia sinensis]|uniref:uncharacterized protein LOC114292646 isoform X6 n=1 Tax=Camellia sinensis TaxID=4442 RepID=UPI001035DFBC|nr:uncharacterized protein LOC114292646 isoform X6 [Camellia sinensis]